MDDVIRHVMVAVGDEDFLTKDFVASVGLRFRLAAHGGQIGTGVRFGQVHGSGPNAGYHLFEESRFQFIRTSQYQGFDSTGGQQRAQ